MAEVFIWKQSPGAQGKMDMRVHEVKFGDGYQQVAKDGINNKVQSWPLTFEGNLAVVQPIFDFLDDKGGAVSFLWTPPGRAQALWRAKSYSMTSIGHGVYSVVTTFEQSFTPA